MVHFVGAGPGAPDLITVRGQRLLSEADVVIYAGSLVNPKLLEHVKKECDIYNSARMTLEEVIAVMENAEKAELTTVRLHTGDPSIYGAVREQMDLLDNRGIPYDSCPGVSSFCGAAAALNLEYTLPGISQSVVITRMKGRTPVPDKETYICTVGTLETTAKKHNITKTALIIVGSVVLPDSYDRSKLYHPEFTTEFRRGTKGAEKS